MTTKLSFHDFFERGKTPIYTCQYDQRFSYCAYVPSQYDEKNKTHPLAVLIHGTERNIETYQDAFADFAEKTDTILLVPLFPGGITAPRELDSYKFIHYEGVKYDDILFAMIKEMEDKYRVDTSKLLLHGFSGGGQFVQRFFYMYPERVMGVSIGAPGWITYIDDTRPWHVGTQDFKEKFGYPLPLETMKGVPVHMVVGSEDNDTWMINYKELEHWMDGLDEHGKTRIERLDALRKNYEDYGIVVKYDMVPGARHEAEKVFGTVKRFFADVLKDNGWITNEIDSHKNLIR